MIFFVTGIETVITASIEKAQARRLKMFDSIHQPAQIITLEYNYDHRDVEKELDVKGRVINIFQYFQQLSYYEDCSKRDQQTVRSVLYQKNYAISQNHLTATSNGRTRVEISYYHNRLYCITYYDRWGYMDRRDFYDYGCQSYTDFYEDKGRLVMRQYYNNHHMPVLTYYYRGSDKNEPALTLIRLDYDGEVKLFDTPDAFRAYFFDRLVSENDHVAFISDRSDSALKPFELMHSHAKCYQVFHSTFTTDGQGNGAICDIYKPIPDMIRNRTLNGVISSTNKEAIEVGKRFGTSHSYHIPVTSVVENLLHKNIPFNKRKKGQLIGIASMDPWKRLDHLIEATIRLHKDFNYVDLKICGIKHDKDTMTKLNKLIQDNHADNYIYICDYQSDLTNIYETADIEVLTSTIEGFSMVLLEAQSHACPVVSYDINYGPSDIIEDGVSGKLVPAGDIDALYNTLKDLLSNRRKLEKYSANAQKAASRFSFTNVSKRWADFLHAEGLWVEPK